MYMNTLHSMPESCGLSVFTTPLCGLSILTSTLCGLSASMPPLSGLSTFTPPRCGLSSFTPSLCGLSSFTPSLCGLSAFTLPLCAMFLVPHRQLPGQQQQVLVLIIDIPELLQQMLLARQSKHYMSLNISPKTSTLMQHACQVSPFCGTCNVEIPQNLQQEVASDP